MAYRRTAGGAAATLRDLTMDQVLEFTLGRPRSHQGPRAFRSDEEKQLQWERHAGAFDREFHKGPGSRLPGWWFVHTGSDYGWRHLPDTSVDELREQARLRGFPWTPQAVAIDLLGEMDDGERHALEARAIDTTEDDLRRWEGRLNIR